MSLFSELKRRNVFRIGAAYAIVAWVIMQVVDLAAPALLLPNWVPSLVVLLLLIGLPVALIMAWAYEVTPDGIKKTPEESSEDIAGEANGRNFQFVVYGLSAAAVLLLAVLNYWPDTPLGSADIDSSQSAESRTPAVAPKVSIAVLPFANMTDDSNQGHFADGITEEILNSLAALSELRVISRTSSFAFRDRAVPIAEIAAVLHVDHILEGSVRRAGNTIRVTAQLIDTSSDSHLWSATYDHKFELDSILRIQEEIATKVVEELHLHLLPQEVDKLASIGPTNLVALDFYHAGMAYLRRIENGTKGDDSNFDPAVRNFKASIETDPNWAPPNAALGRVRHFYMNRGDKTENLRISKGHLLDAIRLDDSYGPAYASLGYVLMVEGDFAGSMRAFDRSSALGHDASWERGILLFMIGRVDEAIVEYLQAIAHDPLKTRLRFDLLEMYACVGRYDEAIEGVKSLLITEPNRESLRIFLATTQIAAGNVDAGLKLADELIELAGDDTPFAATFATIGREGRAQAVLDSLQTQETIALFPAVQIAAALGQDDYALTRLAEAAERAVKETSVTRILGRMVCAPELRRFSGNPRYEEILDLLGVPD